jgi:tetratricopeptide (TPR) repeat protein
MKGTPKSYSGRLCGTTILALVAFSLGFSSQVLGQQPAEEDPSHPEGESVSPRERALDLFAQAEEAYQAGRMEEAIALLIEARSLHSEPVLLYNLARAYEAAGRADEALESYEQYLQEEPDTSDRGAIEQRTAALRAQIEERIRLEQEARQRPRVAAPEGPGPWPWVLGAVGVASAGVGIALAVLSKNARDDADADPVHATSMMTFGRAEDYALGANLTLIAGGALVAGAITWLVLALPTDEDTGARLFLSPTNVTLTLSGF